MRIFRFLLILILIAPLNNVSAQFNFREGTIITLENDTLFGFIKDGGDIRNAKICLFKESKSAEKVKYFPGDIKSYRITGDKYYSAQEFFFKGEFKHVFTDVLLEGQINLYYYWKDNNMSYFIKKEGGVLTGLLNKEVNIQHKSDLGFIVYSTYDALRIPVYKDTLFHLFRDNINTLKQIESLTYNHESLINISKGYLKETCGGFECTSFEKDLNKIRNRIGIYSGVDLSKMYYSESDCQSGFEATFPLGIFINSPLSLINQNLSFQIELIARKLTYDKDFSNLPVEILERNLSSNMVGIPLSLNYKISANKFSPTLGFGKEFGIYFNSDYLNYYSSGIMGSGYIYPFHKGGWFFDLGFVNEMNSKISLFSSIRIQRHFNIITDSQTSNLRTFKNTEGVEYMTNSAALRVGIMF